MKKLTLSALLTLVLFVPALAGDIEHPKPCDPSAGPCTANTDTIDDSDGFLDSILDFLGLS